MSKGKYSLSFLNGALELAVRMSVNMGLDDAVVFSLPKEGLIEAFKKEFRCQKFPLELEEADISLKEALRDFLCIGPDSAELSEKLAELTERHFGKTEKICYPREYGKFRDNIGGRNGPFYNISDVFFTFMPEEVLCFFSGNFE